MLHYVFIRFVEVECVSMIFNLFNLIITVQLTLYLLKIISVVLDFIFTQCVYVDSDVVISS